MKKRDQAKKAARPSEGPQTPLSSEAGSASAATTPPAEPPAAPGTMNAVLIAIGLAGLLFFLNRAASDGEDPATEPGDPVEVGEREVPRTSDPEPAHADDPPVAEPEALTVRVIGSFPHDPRAFTQGLEYHDGVLFEGTGIRRRSTIRRVALETGEVLASVDLPPEVFGEGISVVGERIWQLSWVEGRAFLRSRADFAVEREVTYEGEGWGLCHDGARLVMSDGSDHLFFRDPETFSVTGSVAVTLRGEPLDQLNELECVDGLVYANVWQSDNIARIDPATGLVTGWIDTALHRGSPVGARLLEPADAEHADVLNGIAWMPDRGHFLIGGKEWPRLFEVDFVPAAASD